MSDARTIDAVRRYAERDRLAAELGIAVESLEEGRSRVSLVVRESMTNFHGTVHGTVLFALADVALALASNSRGQTAFALDVSISFLRPARPGDRLVGEAVEVHAAGPTALYELSVRDEATGALVARAQGTTYRKRESFLPGGDVADARGGSGRG